MAEFAENSANFGSGVPRQLYLPVLLPRLCTFQAA